MDSINFSFIVPGSDYEYECRRCLSLWDESNKTTADIKKIRQSHYNCHGWTHCSIDCCGPCPTCGYCDGLDEEEWNYNEDTGQMEEEDPEYSEAKLKDTTGIDWDVGINYD
jgi:hypothetical protein